MKKNATNKDDQYSQMSTAKLVRLLDADLMNMYVDYDRTKNIDSTYVTWLTDEVRELKKRFPETVKTNDVVVADSKMEDENIASNASHRRKM